MAQIMEIFNVTLDGYCETAEGNGFSAEFFGYQYPPKIVLTQEVPPLYIRDADGKEWVEEQAKITIIGSVDGEVAVSGKCTLTKKVLNNLITKGLQLIELYLHGYMQEKKEYETQAGT